MREILVCSGMLVSIHAEASGRRGEERKSGDGTGQDQAVLFQNEKQMCFLQTQFYA